MYPQEQPGSGNERRPSPTHVNNATMWQSTGHGEVVMPHDEHHDDTDAAARLRDTFVLLTAKYGRVAMNMNVPATRGSSPRTDADARQSPR
jgi:hypothetical protein